MTYIIATFIITGLSVWFGFWLGRLKPDASPMPDVDLPVYGSTILDAAVWPDEPDE